MDFQIYTIEKLSLIFFQEPQLVADRLAEPAPHHPGVRPCPCREGGGLAFPPHRCPCQPHGHARVSSDMGLRPLGSECFWSPDRHVDARRKRGVLQALEDSQPGAHASAARPLAPHRSVPSARGDGSGFRRFTLERSSRHRAPPSLHAVQSSLTYGSGSDGQRGSCSRHGDPRQGVAEVAQPGTRGAGGPGLKPLCESGKHAVLCGTITRPFASRTFFPDGEMAHLKGSGQLPARPALGDDSDIAVVGAGGHARGAWGPGVCAHLLPTSHGGAKRGLAAERTQGETAAGQQATGPPSWPGSRGGGGRGQRAAPASAPSGDSGFLALRTEAMPALTEVCTLPRPVCPESAPLKWGIWGPNLETGEMHTMPLTFFFSFCGKRWYPGEDTRGRTVVTGGGWQRGTVVTGGGWQREDGGT